MRKKMKLVLAAWGCVFLLASIPAVAQHDMNDMQGMQGHTMQGMSGMQPEHALRVGKKGEITLTHKAMVAGTELRPGKYVIQHRNAGDQHFVRFVELSKVSNAGRFTYTEEEKAGEIPCKVEPAGEAVKQTTAYYVTEHEGGIRITKVAIRGEDVVHVFE